MLNLSRLRRALKAIEPWYDPRPVEVERIDTKCANFTEETLGQVRRIEVQWLGVHFAVELGCTPPKLTAEELADRRAYYAHLTEGGRPDA